MNKKNQVYLYGAVLVGIIVLGRELSKISYEDFRTEALHLKWAWIFVAIVCMLLHWGIEAKILQVLLARKKGDFSFKNAYRIPLIEHLFNAITPFSSGGQPAQLYALVKSGIDPGVSGSVCLMKFVVYQVMIVINFIACVIFGFKLISGNLTHLSYLIILGFLVHLIVVSSLLMLMYWYSFTNKIVTFIMKIVRKFVKGEKGLALTAQVFEKMDNFYEESLYMKSQTRMMKKTFFLTFIQLVCYYVVPYFILLSLGVTSVNLFEIIVLHAFIILIISLFPIPGGAGGAEYSFTLLFGSFLLVPSKLVFAIVLWRLVTHYIGIVLGLIALLVKPDLPKGIKPKIRKQELA